MVPSNVSLKVVGAEYSSATWALLVVGAEVEEMLASSSPVVEESCSTYPVGVGSLVVVVVGMILLTSALRVVDWYPDLHQQ